MASEVQRARVRSLFVSCARAIVREEGVSGVSARKIAAAAGFSVAAIYNYFTDINQLLWHVFMEEAADVRRELDPHLAGIGSLDGVKELYRAYCRYFTGHPYAFDLMFLTRLGKPPAELSGSTAEPRLAEEAILRLAAGQGRHAPEGPELVRLASLLTAAVHGALLLHCTGKSGTDGVGADAAAFGGGENGLFEKVDGFVDILLG